MLKKREGDRLAAIGQMLAGIVHDLKTPMTIISGYSQLMADIDSQTERKKYSEEILNQFDMMTGMTRSVLAFARGEQDHLIRKVYLQKFFAKVETPTRKRIRWKNIDLEMQLDYTGAIQCDERNMLRLIHNLARNAGPSDGGERGVSHLVKTG